MTLWNVYRFYATYAPDYDNREVVTDNILDAWILAKFKTLLAEVAQAMEKYNLPKAVRPITEFIDELSTWYLRRSRERFKSEDENDKQAALAMSRFVLLELAKVMAPFLPFVAERLWQEVSGRSFQQRNESVHLENWSELGDLSPEEKEILARMTLTRQAAESGLSARDSAGIKIRQMLSAANFQGGGDLPELYQELLAEELNVQTISWLGGEGNLSLNLDTVITPELQLEGNKRELIRTINALRKEAGLTVADKIEIWLDGSEMALSWLSAASEEIKKATLAPSLQSGKADKALAVKSLKLESGNLEIQIVQI
jgi:isoleucyl-tRNA synthetase